MNTNLINRWGSATLWPESLPANEEEADAINKRKRADTRAVAKLVKKSNRILVSISSHMIPFDFFPNTINVEEGRITIITRTFFMSSRVHSVDIKDVSNIFVNVAPLFAQLVIISKTFEENQIRISSLRKDEAVFARRIIEGLRIFANKRIETSNYNVKELVDKLLELSTTEIVT